MGYRGRGRGDCARIRVHPGTLLPMRCCRAVGGLLPRRRRAARWAHTASEVLFGPHAVRAALQAGVRRHAEAFVQDEQRKKLANAEDVARLAAQQGVPVSPVSKADLGNLLGHRFHQGVALRTSPLEAGRVTGDKLPGVPEISAPDAGPRFVLLVDEVTDPHVRRRSPAAPFPRPVTRCPSQQNMGAILRSAHFLGCPHVLISARHTSSLSPVVASTSSGAVDLLVAARRLWRCQSVPRTLSSAQAAGWQVIGADASAEAVPLDALSGAVDVQTPTVLVLVRGRSHIPVPFPASHVAQGSEGYGLRHAVRRLCDSFVAIAGSADMQQGETRPTVDSLNVSVAAGVLLHSARAAWGWT